MAAVRGMLLQLEAGELVKAEAEVECDDDDGEELKEGRQRISADSLSPQEAMREYRPSQEK